MSGKNEVRYKEEKKEVIGRKTIKRKEWGQTVLFGREKGFNITLDRPDVHFSEVRDWIILKGVGTLVGGGGVEGEQFRNPTYLLRRNKKKHTEKRNIIEE